jgi:hypothetical protein
MPNSSLTVRCPKKGHMLIEVQHERGKPMAYCREILTELVKDPSGEVKSILKRSMPKNENGQTFATVFDLLEEEPHSTTVITSCQCKTFHVSLKSLLDDVRAGKRGKLILPE